MRVTSKLTRVVLGAGAAALILGLQASAAKAETASGAAAVGSEQSSASRQVGTYQVASASAMTRRRSGRYFIEFRSRNAASYGHMYVLYGRVNGAGQIVKSEIAGLHPAGDAADCYNCSVVPWTLGHLLFVPAETGPSDGDLEEKYVTARYRIWLSAAEYKDVSAYIAKLKGDTKVWNALWANCVGFGRRVAEHMGLQVPAFIWLQPDQFVVELRKLNGGPEKEQSPLRDAPNSLKTSAGFKTSLPKQVGLPPSRPTAVAPVSATARAVEPATAKPAMTPAANEKSEVKPTMKPAAENATKDKKPATEGMAASSATR